MNVLAVIHGEQVRSGVFGEAVEGRGHRLEEWSLAWGTPPPRPIDDYSAVLVFGGAMHADQDEHHPWLREENLFIQRLLDRHVPMLGICLGAQLIAKACHARVYAARESEIGWVPVELTAAAYDDPLFAGVPPRFRAFQWHYYTYELPAGAEELARSEVCTQAFRIGDAAWGIQFHAEVTRQQLESWAAQNPETLPVSKDEFARGLDEHLGAWSELGRAICGAFLEVAERVGVPA